MAVPLTLVLMACVFTAYTKGSNSLHLTSFQATASPGQPFTLMCSSSDSAERPRAWYWRNDVIFRPRYTSNTNCHLDIMNSDKYEHLLGRINVACSHNQHNLTLRILTSIDNRSVCWCVKETESQESNRLTIDVVNLMTASSTATTTATTTTTDAPKVVYIAVGAAVGGVVVGCVISAIVFIMWMRMRNTSTEDDASAPNIYTAPSYYVDMEHQYGKVERQYVHTVEVSGTGSPDSVNTEDQAGNAAYYNTTGQHQHPDEDANAGNTTYYQDARDADN